MDGFVFFRLSYCDYSDLQLFAIFMFEVDFLETKISRQVLKLTFQSLQILEIFWGRIPQTPLQGSCIRRGEVHNREEGETARKSREEGVNEMLVVGRLQ